MKKYVKPELFYEHYELSQHIADCAWEWVNHTDELTCTAVADPDFLPWYVGPDYMLFTAEPVCTFPSYKLGDYCYENALPGANLFKS